MFAAKIINEPSKNKPNDFLKLKSFVNKMSKIKSKYARLAMHAGINFKAILFIIRLSAVMIGL